MKQLFVIVCLLAACESERQDDTVQQWWSECQDVLVEPPICYDGDTQCLDDGTSSVAMYCDCGGWRLVMNCDVFSAECSDDVLDYPFCYNAEDNSSVEDAFGTQEEPKCAIWLDTIHMLTYLCRTRIFEKCAQQWCD